MIDPHREESTYNLDTSHESDLTTVDAVEASDIPNEVLSMYMIPGFDLREDDVARYLRKSNDVSKIAGDITSTIKYRLSVIGSVPPPERATIISEYLKTANEEDVKVAVEKIKSVPEEDRKELILLAMRRGFSDIIADAGSMIYYLSVPGRTDLVSNLIDSDNSEIRKAAAEMIWSVEQEAMPELISKGIDDPDIGVARIAAQEIKRLPEHEKVEQIVKLADHGYLEIIYNNLMNWDFFILEEGGLTQKIDALVHQWLDSGDVHQQSIAVKMIHFCSPEVEAQLRAKVHGIVFEHLSSEDAGTQKLAAGMVRHVVPEQRVDLIRNVLASGNAELQKEVINEIRDVPKEDQLALVSSALETGHRVVINRVANMVRFLPLDERTTIQQVIHPIVDKVLESSDIEAIGRISGLIGALPVDKCVSLIETLMRIEGVDILKVISDIVSNIPTPEAEGLVNLLIDSENKNVQLAAVKGIIFADAKQQSGLVHKALGSTYADTRAAAVVLIERVPDDQKSPLVLVALSDENSDIQYAALSMIHSVPARECENLINKALSSQFPSTRLLASKMIGFIPEIRQDEFRSRVQEIVLRDIEAPDREEQINATTMLKQAPLGTLDSILPLIIEKDLGGELIKPPLYDGIKLDNFSTSSRFRQEFAKDGTRTTLVGGNLQNKVIVRHIPLQAYQMWQHAYESYGTWQQMGLDYVPIEPIVSAQLTKDGIVNVSSGVLDLSLASWVGMTDLFKNELIEQQKKILKGLDSLEIIHGHTHNNNFLLRFFRDSVGRPNFSQVPRLYIIDFDMAWSNP